jgi:histidinol phosphatase-like enzyme
MQFDRQIRSELQLSVSTNYRRNVMPLWMIRQGIGRKLLQPSDLQEFSESVARAFAQFCVYFNPKSPISRTDHRKSKVDGLETNVVKFVVYYNQ